MTQRKRVEEKLRRDGEVTNLWAITNGMWRLGDIIHRMRADGWDIHGDYVEGTKNFQYTLVAEAAKPVTWVKNPLTGERITSEQLAAL